MAFLDGWESLGPQRWRGHSPLFCFESLSMARSHLSKLAWTTLVVVLLVGSSKRAAEITREHTGKLAPIHETSTDTNSISGPGASFVPLAPRMSSAQKGVPKDRQTLPQAVTETPLWKRASNLLANGSFETGREPWLTLRDPHWTNFKISQDYAHSGRQSAKLDIDSEGHVERGTRVCGIVRDLRRPKFPKILSGWYRVEQWHRGTKLQYVQVVIGAMNTPEYPEIGDSPVQLAYVLTGVNKPPLDLVNRRFAIAGTKNPKVGKWIQFKFYLHDDFRWYWKRVPTQYSNIRILFETRFDDLQPGEDDVLAEVYFDDLYLGSGE